MPQVSTIKCEGIPPVILIIGAARDGSSHSRYHGYCVSPSVYNSFIRHACQVMFCSTWAAVGHGFTERELINNKTYGIQHQKPPTM